MSALQLAPTQPTEATEPTEFRRAPSGPVRRSAAGQRPPLRLVEAPPPSRSWAPSGPLQAWRRRIGALLVLLAVVVLAVEAFSSPVAPAPEVVPASSSTVVVEPGQTLWDLAGQHAPQGVATDAYVRQLAELNGVTNGELDAWQVLRLPAG